MLTAVTVMWLVTPSVCASPPNAAIHPKLPQLLNVLVLIHMAYLLELSIQHKRHKHEVHIFLVSVTRMYINQLNTIVNALCNISHTTILQCEVPFVSWCTNLVLWISHFDTVSDVCTDAHKIKLYLKPEWLTVTVCKHIAHYSCCCCRHCCITISFFIMGEKYIT
jgi:hypothetical protein